jgi:hypothetical protein
MCSENPVEVGDVEFLSEDVNGVRAIEAERRLLEESVPQLLKPDCGIELTRLPENSDHFSICPQAGRGVLSSNLPHCCVYGRLKKAPVRLPSDHELSKGVLGIQEDQLRGPDCDLCIGAEVIQLPAKQLTMLGSDDHKLAVPALYPFPQVQSDIPAQSRLVGLVKLNKVPARMRPF